MDVKLDEKFKEIGDLNENITKLMENEKLINDKLVKKRKIID